MNRSRSLPVVLFVIWITSCHHNISQHAIVSPPTAESPYYVITEPVVNTRLHGYPDVHYEAGDRVTIVEAGGCVNTGGTGKTWKDYTSPKGANSARLYHGLIWLPGAVESGFHVPVGTGPVRLEGIVGKTFTISADGLSTADLHLYLGYEDDHYFDNGYYRDSAGATNEQCKPIPDKSGKSRVPRAYVKLRIEHGSVDSQVALKPFDLVASRVDSNGVLNDPIWWYQHDKQLVSERPDPNALPDVAKLCGSFPSELAKRTYGFALCPEGCRDGDCKCENPCSSQAPSFDYPIDLSINKWVSCFGNKVGASLNGHANWTPVSYEGVLTWAGEQPFDEDADIMLHRPVAGKPGSFDWSGFSASESDEIEIEMAGYETWDSFGTEWFVPHWARHNRDEALGKGAQVIGLMSLDCVHQCKVELHPIYAIAIHVSGPDPLPNGQWDDQWAIFARNWGNEGWCSHDQHFLDRDRLSFVLPGPTAATAVAVVADDSGFINPAAKKGMTEFKANMKGVGLFGPSFLPNQGARITFLLGTPERKARVNGFLHLNWTAPPGPAVNNSPPPVPSVTHKVHETELNENGPKASNVPPDNVPIVRLSDEPSNSYTPAPDAASLTASKKESRDRKSCAIGASNSRVRVKARKYVNQTVSLM